MRFTTFRPNAGDAVGLANPSIKDPESILIKYINYIQLLQGQHILSDDMEELELEELQGVSGLKALRVGVIKDTREVEQEKGKKETRCPEPLKNEAFSEGRGR